MKTGFTIKTIAERTGVSVHRLRAWERRYGVPLPQRGDDNRYRLYDEQDISDILWMRRQVDAGMSPAQAGALLHQQRRPRAAVEALAAQPASALQKQLLEALVLGDENQARRILDEAFSVLSLEQVAPQIIQPALSALGDKWMADELAVWQEHLASNLIRQKLVSILQAQPSLNMSLPHLVAVCAPEEQHELGLLIVTLLARRNGWNVTYIGQRTPLVELNELADNVKPHALAVSVATVIGLAGLIGWFEEKDRPQAQLLFGGSLFDRTRTLREHIPGVYLGADAVSAIRTLNTTQLSTRLWSPPKRALETAQTLQARRVELTSHTVARFVSLAHHMSGAQRSRLAHELSQATFFLIDALACALAFDAPELVEQEGAWLKVMLSPRQVAPELVHKHLETFSQMIEKHLEADSARRIDALVERLQVNFDQGIKVQ